MIFKPLGVLGDGLRTMCGLFINIFHKTFPRAFQTKGIAIDLDEPIDEINCRIVFSHPFNAIFIENI